jgi:hypothetical protein
MSKNHMRNVTFALLTCITAFLAALPVQAQNRQTYPEGTVRIDLTDGSAVVGIIEREDDVEIEIRTATGVVMTIPRAQVKTIASIEGERFFRADPNQTRLFFAPTGRAAGPGAGYLAFYEVVVPFVAIGAGHAVTLAGGMTINPGSERFVYAAPKVTVFSRPNMNVALGGIAVGLLGAGDGGTAGLVFGVGTFGPPSASLSAGLAFGFSDEEIGQKPALMVGGEYQLSNSLKLLTENYVFVGVEGGVLVSGGLRFFGEKIAADIGLFTFPVLLDDSDFFFIPWLGFAYNFGR